MPVVDAFRFAASVASEADLAHQEAEPLRDLLSGRVDGLASHSVIALFDQDVLQREEIVVLIREMIGTGNFSFCFLAPIDDADPVSTVHAIAEIGCSAITFHPYIQRIDAEKLPVVLDIARCAGDLGMYLNVCAAFGGHQIYAIEPLRTVQAIAERTDCTVVVVHCGGARVIEALLLAEAFPSILLETSFTLSYWIGSSVEQDLAFAIKKLGAERWLFGSDAPFMPFQSTHDDHLKFFVRHEFNDREIGLIMYENTRQLLHA